MLGLPARFSSGSTCDGQSQGTPDLWVLSGECRQSVGVRRSTMVVVGSLQVLAGYSWRWRDGRSLEIHFSHLPIPNGNKSLKMKAMIHKILGDGKS